ncbi:zinc finger and BTB domain-containing protein 42 isoform X1 [Manis pentadactyla]|uniref:zinc finger and BTB domain-containing protein 42 isoform X1 n=1 Tax=Manis pentadactyla TaxID=143292 RepID=UPI00255C6741|nr:zinc finger and BTB domain-containing protein 42 isoform X1 [Manis pentadactyla]
MREWGWVEAWTTEGSPGSAPSHGRSGNSPGCSGVQAGHLRNSFWPGGCITVVQNFPAYSLLAQLHVASLPAPRGALVPFQCQALLGAPRPVHAAPSPACTLREPAYNRYPRGQGQPHLWPPGGKAEPPPPRKPLSGPPPAEWQGEIQAHGQAAQDTAGPAGEPLVRCSQENLLPWPLGRAWGCRPPWSSWPWALSPSAAAGHQAGLRDRPAGGRDTVRLNGDIVTAPAFGRLLDFMYEGRLDLRSVPVEDVLAAASYLHMYDIVKVCKGRLREREQALLRENPAPPGKPGPPGPPLCPLPAWTPELCPAAQKARLPGTGVKAALPPRALVPPPWQPPGESDRALDLSLKPRPRQEPVHPLCTLQAAPHSQVQQGTPPLVKDEQDSLSGQEGSGPQSPHSTLQPPCAPASKGQTVGLEPLPFSGVGSRELEPDAERGARGDERGPSGHLCVCPLCSKLFPSAHMLQLHLSAHFRERDGSRAKLSPDGTVPTCPLCGKTFSCTYTLKRHERTHSGEKPYTCVQCGKGFQYSHNLSRHAVVHTREKPHACRWCERRFTQSGDLYRHVRKFHCGLVRSLLV